MSDYGGDWCGGGVVRHERGRRVGWCVWLMCKLVIFWGGGFRVMIEF